MSGLASSSDPRRPPLLASWQRDIAAALVGGAALGLVVLLWLQRRPPAHPGPAAAPGSAVQAPTGARAPAPRDGIPLPAGPWGNLRAATLWLAPMPDAVTPAECLGEVQPWRLPGHDRSRVQELLQRAGLPRAQADALLARGRCDAAGCVLNPTAGEREDLPAAARAVLYPVLATEPQNQVQATPFRFRADQVQAWLRASELADPLKARLQRLLFPQGQALTFADQDTLCSQLSEPERAAVLRAVAMAPAELVTLEVAGGQGVDALVAYYGASGRADQVRPVLAALARRPGGGAIDISELLPPFARERLYRYPGRQDPEYNCHHSSMNFFAAAPDPRILPNGEIERILRERYTPLKSDDTPRLGDVITLERGNGAAVHSMSYIAADIVFTKNGHWRHAPWILARMRDVVAVYQDGQVSEHRYRPRP